MIKDREDRSIQFLFIMKFRLKPTELDLDLNLYFSLGSWWVPREYSGHLEFEQIHAFLQIHIAGVLSDEIKIT